MTSDLVLGFLLFLDDGNDREGYGYEQPEYGMSRLSI